jgi:tape measure domain-containing protein
MARSSNGRFSKASFAIQLRDGVTGPSRRMGASLGFLNNKLRSVERSVDRLNNKSLSGYSRRLRGATRETDRFKRSQAGAAKVSWSRLGDGLKGVATAATAAGAAIGFVLGRKLYELTDLAGRSQLAFQSMFGTKELGSDQLDNAVRLANTFGFQLGDTISQVQKFNSLGFTPVQAEELVKMGGDMRALGRSSEEVRRVFLQLGQINAKGKLQGEELIVLAENGVNLGMVYDRLGKKLGKTREEIIKMQGAGELKSGDALNSIAETILITLGQSKLGEAGKAAAENTLGGVVGLIGTRLETGLFNAARSAEPALVRGMQSIFRGVEQLGLTGTASPLTGFLENVGLLLEKIGPKLPAIVENFTKAFSAASGLDITGIDGLADRLPGIATQIGKIAGDMVTIAGYIGKLASIGDFFNITGSLGSGSGIKAEDYQKPKTFGIAQVASDDPMVKYGAEYRAKYHEVGSQAALGLANGISDNSNIAVDAARNMGTATLNALREEHETHSPSKAFHDIGVSAPEGLAFGMQESSDVAISSARGLGHDTLDSTAQALRSNSFNYGAITSGAADSITGNKNRSSISIGEIKIIVEGSSDPGATGRSVMQSLELELADLLERHSQG